MYTYRSHVQQYKKEYKKSIEYKHLVLIFITWLTVFKYIYVRNLTIENIIHDSLTQIIYVLSYLV